MQKPTLYIIQHSFMILSEKSEFKNASVEACGHLYHLYRFVPWVSVR